MGGKLSFDFSGFNLIRENEKTKKVTDKVLERDYSDLYCRKICTMIAFYIQKMYCFDLLQMKAVFVRDDLGRIWLFHVDYAYV